jgi:membrane protein implicated in regulation of membrane protease activity
MNYSIFSSRTFWTILAMFVVGGLNAITQALPPNFQVVAMAVLSWAATYFHTHPSQQYNPPQA